MESQKVDKFLKAQKRVKAIKGFYSEVLLFILITCLLFLFKGEITGLFGNIGHNINFLKWLDLNLMLVPLWWGIILLIKAKCIFKYKLGFMEKWEQRQIKKYME